MLRLLMVLAFGLLCGGCADLTGTWVSQGLDPQMARDQFRLLRAGGHQGDFLRAKLDLREDKTYVAEVYYATDMSFSNGGWQLVGDRLRLIDNKFGTQTVQVKVSRDGTRMDIIQPIKGTDVRLLMRKEDSRFSVPLLNKPR